MSSNAAQGEWVARVLGLSVAMAKTEPATSAAGTNTVPAETQNGGDGGNAAFTESALMWRDCKQAMTDKIAQLKSAILDAYADEPEVQAEVRGGLGALDDAVAGLDGRLETTLDAAIKARDPAQQRELAQQTKAIIADYIKFVASEKRIAVLDDNALGIPMGLGASLTRTLTSLVGLTRTMS
jgi:hypothetical protein